MGPLTTLGAFAAVSFVVVFVLDGWTRPGYRPVRHPVSALALGPRGWRQTANFLACGTGIAIGAAGLTAHHGWLALVLGILGLALVASGVWPMDAMRGYPPGTPDAPPAHFTRRHRLHDAAGAVVFATLPIAALTAALGDLDAWLRWYSGATAVASGALMLVFGAAWENDAPRAGLWQRLTLLVGWTWLAVLFSSVPRG